MATPDADAVPPPTQVDGQPTSLAVADGDTLQDVNMSDGVDIQPSEAAYMQNGQIPLEDVQQPLNVQDGETAHPTAEIPSINGTTAHEEILPPQPPSAADIDITADGPLDPAAVPTSDPIIASQNPPTSQPSISSAQGQPTVQIVKDFQSPARGSTPTPGSTPVPGGLAIPSANLHGSPTRVYLNSRVTPAVLEGMKWIAKNEPEKPLKWLSEYLARRSAEVEGP